MKHIGREVLFLAAGEENPRNGESTMIRLKDGKILFVYTQYYGDSWEDHAIAHLCACLSHDEGGFRFLRGRLFLQCCVSV